MVGGNPFPTRTTCPSCRQEVTSVTKSVNGLLTWLACGGLCLIGCVFGCCLIPFCVDACKDIEHYCPNCNTYIGIYERIG
ncbi:lipopolysaccharide-induced tumor necrosis factor-alpha factor-like isoform X2 [Dinothrombium tinctorium]|uniref:Lipopolysaccharide-induced tumor necrosis factor-alpha factor-like isoform X2 n=1 Tax=Dinothrombium tinctorium TaxID=1965070 RepID=A0A3S3QQW4_9ACAR|nr:lipopolysaccharide-induced tumor necrosis factor-alpha factor-like isoform X2 [Dinothrombium tinctorium]